MRRSYNLMKTAGGCPLFLCVWDRGGFSVVCGAFLRVKRGVCQGGAGIGTWIWSFWRLVSAEGGECARMGLSAGRFRCFRGGRAQH